MGFFDIFKKKEEKANVTIEVTKEGLIINENDISLPASLDSVIGILGNFSREIAGQSGSNNIHVWDALGIYIHTQVDTGMVIQITVLINKTEELPFLPKKIYKGDFMIEGRDIKDKKLDADTYIYHEEKIGKNTLIIRVKEKDISFIKSYTIYATPEKKKPENPNKYKIVPIENALTFADFNFKLLIIEELMYNKELLTPKLEAYEFAELYTEREIDIEEDGYDPIPEIEEYFRDLPISKELAKEVTSIYQDGGNEVYMQITPFWDGEDNYFDLESVKDAKLFPNLKKAVIFGTNKELIEELKSYGVDAKPL